MVFITTLFFCFYNLIGKKYPLLYHYNILVNYYSKNYGKLDDKKMSNNNPKKYLQDNGYNDKNLYNQVANYTYLDTVVNIAVGKKEPKEYFSEAFEGCAGNQTIGTITDKADLWENLATNCIPQEVVNMTYENYVDFLRKRRVLMAQKIRDYYEAL